MAATGGCSSGVIAFRLATYSCDASPGVGFGRGGASTMAGNCVLKEQQLVCKQWRDCCRMQQLCAALEFCCKQIPSGAIIIPSRRMVIAAR